MAKLSARNAHKVAEARYTQTRVEWHEPFTFESGTEVPGFWTVAEHTEVFALRSDNVVLERWSELRVHDSRPDQARWLSGERPIGGAYKVREQHVTPERWKVYTDACERQDGSVTIVDALHRFKAERLAPRG